MEVFDRKKALEMLEGEEELLVELEKAFVSRNFDRNHFEKLVGCHSMNDAAGYVHSFKGSARQLACGPCAQAGQNLEDFLRGKVSGEVEFLVDAFLREFGRAFNAIASDLGM